MDAPAPPTDAERLQLLRDAIDELAPRLVGDLDVLLHTTEPAARLDMLKRVVHHAATLRSASWNLLRVADTDRARLERALEGTS